MPVLGDTWLNTTQGWRNMPPQGYAARNQYMIDHILGA